LVIVHAEVWGPSGSAVLSLALDTGATFTLVNQGRLMQLGYDPAIAPKRFQVSTASGVEFVPRLTVTKIAAWDKSGPTFLSYVTPYRRA